MSWCSSSLEEQAHSTPYALVQKTGSTSKSSFHDSRVVAALKGYPLVLDMHHRRAFHDSRVVAALKAPRRAVPVMSAITLSTTHESWLR